MRKVRLRINLVILIALFCAPLVSAQTSSRSDAKVRERFFDVDRAFSNLSEKSGPLKAFIEFSTSDAYILPRNGSPAYGREGIRKFYGDFPADDKLIWEPTEGECSSDGSLGYTIGKYKYEYEDSTGKAASREGEYVTAGQRQADGSLKYIADMGHPVPIPAGEDARQSLKRKSLKTIRASDFQIAFGTFEVKEGKGRNLKVSKRGNYITAWRIDRSGKKKVLADFSN